MKRIIECLEMLCSSAPVLSSVYSNILQYSSDGLLQVP
uniref:Uncharacterized protein n=1 Tax=Arundo donax TaxID=35708 RepID=A0A0A9BUC0_ARUDO